MIGNVLALKPIIELKDGALIKLGVARGQRKGREYLFKEFEAAPVDPEWPVLYRLYIRQEAGRGPFTGDL